MEILKVNDVSKTYEKGRKRIEALKNVNFRVHEGEFVSIIGPSGSGKSTLMNIISNIDSPSSGTVIFKDNDINKLRSLRGKSISCIFQKVNLAPKYTVDRNIRGLLILENREMNMRLYNELIIALGLKDLRHKMISELSEVQKRIVEIGKAFVTKPDLILADEPTRNLDTMESRKVLDLLKSTAKKYKKTLIMFTKDSEAAYMADTIMTIENGIVM